VTTRDQSHDSEPHDFSFATDDRFDRALQERNLLGSGGRDHFGIAVRGLKSSHFRWFGPIQLSGSFYMLGSAIAR
jgi:hypothetical protein